MKKSTRKKSNKKNPLLFLILILIVITGIIVYLVVSNSPGKTPRAAVSTAPNSIDQVIATRPDHANPHAVHLPLPMYGWSWGQHGTEDNKSHGSGSINLWLAMLYDESNINHIPNVKLNIRRMYGYAYSNGTWTSIYDGLPTWYVTTPDTGGGYVDIAPTKEADGSYSFVVPKNLMMHMSTPAPGLLISGAQGVLSVVEARLLGTPTDIAASKLALSAGADYRDAAGSGGSITQSGFGQGGLLTGDWQSYDMVSTTLTDTQLKSNPPPGLSSATSTSTPDTTSPTVIVTSPASGAVLTANSIPMTATATDPDDAVSKVEFYVNNSLVGTSTSAPFAFTWSPSSLPNGTYSIFAKGYDSATPANIGQSTTITVTQNLTSTSTSSASAPVISNITAAASTNSANITWTTDLSCDSSVIYDTNTNLSLSTLIDSNLTTSHSVNLSGLQPNTLYYYKVKSINSAGLVATSSMLTFTTQPLTLSGNVFTGQYYDNMDLTNLKLTRQDPVINFNWGTGSPDPTVGADTFSARWTGTFDFPQGAYNFTATSDDGIRIWIDNVQVLNKWLDQGATTYKFSQIFPSSGKHTIVIEYYENGYDAVAKFNWVKTTNFVEAESMKLSKTWIAKGGNVFSDPTASGGKGLEIYSKGTASGQITSFANSITVRAEGDQCNGAPHMVIKVDGKTTFETDVSSTTWNDYSSPINLPLGTHTITVTFTNDYNSLSCDRNLLLDKITFN